MPKQIDHSNITNENSANATIKKIEKSINIKTKGKCISKRLFIGIFSITIALSVFIAQPYKHYKRMKLTLIEGGELFGLWMKANVDPITKIYLFNVTNKDKFLEGKEKLRVQEVGPYIYKECSTHKDPIFNHEDGTVFTRVKHKFEWVPELNTRSENDTFVLPNIPFLLFAGKFSGKLMAVNVAANLGSSFTRSEPITTQTVRDVLFGIESPFISLGNTFVPQWITFEKFGLFEQICGVTQDTSETYTGEKDFNIAGRIAKYNDREVLPQWDKAPCNQIVGATDGKKFGNNIQANETLKLYHRALCRSIPIVQAGPQTVSDQWLPTVPYKIPDDALDNGETNPDNKCFCRKGKCLPSGLVDLKDCYYGFSVGVSFPHFYKGHHSLIENVDGLHPNASLHDSEWHLNTDIGILTNCSIKLQFNLVLDNIDILGGQRFSNLTVPIAWGELTFPRLHPVTALRMFVAFRILPIVEKACIVFWLFVGLYCICHEMLVLGTKKKAENNTEYFHHEKEAVQSVLLLPS